MKLDWFDANVSVGLPAGAVAYRPVATCQDLLDEFDRHGVRNGLVWHIAQHDASPDVGNELVNEWTAASDRLFGCWTLLPPLTDGAAMRDLVPRMREHRIVALRAFPDRNIYLLRRTVVGPLLDELVRKRVPLLLSLEFGIGWPAVYEVLHEFPELTCILCDIGVWGQDRRVWPLLEQYARVYVESSYLSLEAGGLEAAARRFGAGRIVFGSAYPRRYLGAAQLDVLHADLSDDDKRRIAGGTLRDLIAGVDWS